MSDGHAVPATVLLRNQLRSRWLRLAVLADRLTDRRTFFGSVWRPRIGGRALAGLVLFGLVLGRRRRNTVSRRRLARLAHGPLQRPSRSESPGIARSARSLRRCQASRVACFAFSHSSFELPRVVLQSRPRSDSTSSKVHEPGQQDDEEPNADDDARAAHDIPLGAHRGAVCAKATPMGLAHSQTRSDGTSAPRADSGRLVRSGRRFCMPDCSRVT